MYDIHDDTTAVVESLDLQTVKNYLRIPTDNSSDDADINEFIQVARKKFEEVTWRSVTAKTLVLTMDNDEQVVELPFPPINEVTKVSYWDGTDSWVEITVDEDYFVFGEDRKWIELVYYKGYKLKIEFTTLADESSEYLNLIKQYIAAIYDNRPDSEEVQEKIIKRMARLRVFSCR
jgi:hypothetical protein